MRRSKHLEKLYNSNPSSNPLLGNLRAQSLTTRPTTSTGITIYNKKSEKYKDKVTKTSDNFYQEKGIKTFRIKKSNIFSLPYNFEAIRQIPFRRKFVRDKVFLKGIKQTSLSEKRSLSHKESKKIFSMKNKSKKFFKEAWNTNIKGKLKLQQQLRRMGKLRKFGDVVNQKIKKVKLLRNNGLGGKLFFKNQFFDREREWKVKKLMEKFEGSDFVKELIKSKRRFKWEKNVENDWEFKEELLEYDASMKQVKALDVWEKGVL